MACRYLSLTETKKDDETKRAGETDWFKAWYSAVKIPKASAHRMWDEFKVATGLSITPGKASVEQQPTIYYQSSIKHSFNNQVVAFVN